MDYRDIARNFGILNRRSQAFITTACTPLGIGFTEYTVLLKLYMQEGCNQEELSSMLAMDKSLTARTVKSLESKGFIYRSQTDADKRLKRIYTTDYGASLKETLMDLLQGWIDILAQGIEEGTVEAVFKGLHIAAENAIKAEIRGMACNLVRRNEDET